MFSVGTDQKKNGHHTCTYVHVSVSLQWYICIVFTNRIVISTVTVRNMQHAIPSFALPRDDPAGRRPPGDLEDEVCAHVVSS
jgi:hypothetical protein